VVMMMLSLLQQPLAFLASYLSFSREDFTMKVPPFSTFATTGLISATTAQKLFDLSEAKWTLTSPGNSSIQVPGCVPSQAHLDLYAAGVIPDPYFGLGDFELRWVAYSNWTYSAELEGL
jgi:beta-mannosidase